MSQHGDDLTDDFVPDDTVALDDDDAAGSLVADNDDIGKLLSADEEDDDRPDEKKALMEKKRKRREKEKERKLKVSLFCRPPSLQPVIPSLLHPRPPGRLPQKRKLAEPTQEASIAAQPPAALADYLSTMQAKSFPKMSAIELQDRQIPGAPAPLLRPARPSDIDRAGRVLHSGHDRMDGIEELGRSRPIYSPRCARLSVTRSDPPPVSAHGSRVHSAFHVLTRTLALFWCAAVPTLHTRLSQRTKSPGAPTLLFLTGAALRVADVTRTLKSKTLRGEKGADVAKLFAKHFKLQEHVEYLHKAKVGAAVGTPGRVGKLLCETGAYIPCFRARVGGR